MLQFSDLKMLHTSKKDPSCNKSTCLNNIVTILWHEKLANLSSTSCVFLSLQKMTPGSDAVSTKRKISGALAILI